MSTFSKGDKVRCIETWTTHVIDSGDEFTVDAWRVDSEADVMEVLVNGEWVPARYFEKVEPEFTVGQTVSGDDYARLPVGSVIESLDGIATKVGEDAWRWDDGEVDANKDVRARRTLTHLGDGTHAEPEDKADLYVEPEPLKEGRWVHVWARVEDAKPDGEGEIEIRLHRASDRYHSTYTLPGAIVRPAAGQVPPWVKPARCTSLHQDAPTYALWRCDKPEHNEIIPHGTYGSCVTWTTAEEAGRITEAGAS